MDHDHAHMDAMDHMDHNAHAGHGHGMQLLEKSISNENLNNSSDFLQYST